EYGGAPRRMLPAVAAFERLVGVPEACVRITDTPDLQARVFRTRHGPAAVVWRPAGRSAPLSVPPGVRAFDVMGVRLAATGPHTILLDASPVYLTAPDEAALAAALPPG
ncbi:MAG: hypothetical protein KJ579_05185, partial [Verrucomicrobia bacterium]|nr:hypothetical protein [Verrucomicrobiota bacterium]